MIKVRSYMLDMIIMLLATAVVAVYTYGIRALASIVLSVIVAVMTEALGYMFFMKKNPTRLADMSAIFTGLVVALALPSSAPLWLAPLGAAIAIAVAKIPFGDTTTAPFVPAAVGLGFITLSYPDYVFTYPNLAIGKLTAATGTENFVEGTSLAQMLTQSKSIGSNILNVLDVFVGRIPGPMGASCLILMIGTLFYLVIRRRSESVTTISFLLTCMVIAFFFPRVLSGRLYSVLMELSAGLLFYSAVFFLSDPLTGPKTKLGRILYGVCAGILTMVIRHIGAYEESVIFVILIMNAISDIFDGLGETIASLVSSIGVFDKLPKLPKRQKKQKILAEGEPLEKAPRVKREKQPKKVREPKPKPELPKAQPRPEKRIQLIDLNAPVEDEKVDAPKTESSTLRTMTVEELLASLSTEGGNKDGE